MQTIKTSCASLRHFKEIRNALLMLNKSASCPGDFPSVLPSCCCLFVLCFHKEKINFKSKKSNIYGLSVGSWHYHCIALLFGYKLWNSCLIYWIKYFRSKWEFSYQLPMESIKYNMTLTLFQFLSRLDMRLKSRSNPTVKFLQTFKTEQAVVLASRQYSLSALVFSLVFLLCSLSSCFSHVLYPFR